MLLLWRELKTTTSLMVKTQKLNRCVQSIAKFVQIFVPFRHLQNCPWEI